MIVIIHKKIIPLRTSGPPESPSHESFPPLDVPAHKNILGIH